MESNIKPKPSSSILQSLKQVAPKFIQTKIGAGHQRETGVQIYAAAKNQLQRNNKSLIKMPMLSTKKIVLVQNSRQNINDAELFTLEKFQGASNVTNGERLPIFDRAKKTHKVAIPEGERKNAIIIKTRHSAFRELNKKLSKDIDQAIKKDIANSGSPEVDEIRLVFDNLKQQPQKIAASLMAKGKIKVKNKLTQNETNESLLSYAIDKYKSRKPNAGKLDQRLKNVVDAYLDAASNSDTTAKQNKDINKFINDVINRPGTLGIDTFQAKAVRNYDVPLLSYVLLEKGGDWRIASSVVKTLRESGGNSNELDQIKEIIKKARNLPQYKIPAPAFVSRSQKEKIAQSRQQAFNENGNEIAALLFSNDRNDVAANLKEFNRDLKVFLTQQSLNSGSKNKLLENTDSKGYPIIMLFNFPLSVNNKKALVKKLLTPGKDGALPITNILIDKTIQLNDKKHLINQCYQYGDNPSNTFVDGDKPVYKEMLSTPLVAHAISEIDNRHRADNHNAYLLMRAVEKEDGVSVKYLLWNGVIPTRNVEDRVESLPDDEDKNVIISNSFVAANNLREKFGKHLCDVQPDEWVKAFDEKIDDCTVLDYLADLMPRISDSTIAAVLKKEEKGSLSLDGERKAQKNTFTYADNWTKTLKEIMDENKDFSPGSLIDKAMEKEDWVKEVAETKGFPLTMQFNRSNWSEKVDAYIDKLSDDGLNELFKGEKFDNDFTFGENLLYHPYTNYQAKEKLGKYVKSST